MNTNHGSALASLTDNELDLVSGGNACPPAPCGGAAVGVDASADVGLNLGGLLGCKRGLLGLGLDLGLGLSL